MGSEPSRPSVILWLDPAADLALLERVRGQLSDLELELRVVETKPEVFEPALALAWFTRPDAARDRVEVHVAAGQPVRTFVREIGDGGVIGEGALSSATLEAAALVVRESVRDLSRSDPPLPEPRADSKSTPPVIRAPPVLASRSESEARFSLRGELGWSVVLDGVGWFRRQGPAFGLGGSYRDFRLALVASLSLPVSEQDYYGAIRLRRQEFGVRGGYEWRPSSATALSVELRAGVVLYARSAEQLRPVVSPSGDRVNVSALIGPELRFGFAPNAGPFELFVCGGLWFVPGAPRIGYQVDARFEPSFSLWRWQPTLGIGLAFGSTRGH